MQLIRTTLRIKETLKEALEKRAFMENKTLQEVYNEALEYYLTEKAERKAKKIVFKIHDLGVPLDNLKRKNFYQ